MLSEEEALAAVLERAKPLPPRRIPLMDALGCPLAEPIVAGSDLPPFDKALMDGFAVNAADLAGPGPHRLRIGEEILAGRPPTRPLARGEAASIMTGAPLPPGADAVVMHERTESPGDGSVVLRDPVRPGLAVLARGREMRTGDVLFEPGSGLVLTAAHLGVLASIGRDSALVTPRPRVAILPTGDELVAIADTPGPGQIRESNSILLAALARSVGAEAEVRPTAPDDPDALGRAIAGALQTRPDVLLLCGGVSAGKKDLVPAALEALGIAPVFHKVRLKPGKPLLFGVGPGGAPLVFGLPGNPVSGLVGFLLFVRPALEVLGGRSARGTPRSEGRLAADFRHRGDRPTYHPARIVASEGPDLRLEPMDWAGSADLRAVALSHGFVRFPEGDRDYEAGDPVAFLPAPDAP